MERPRIAIKNDLKPIVDFIVQNTMGTILLPDSAPTNDTMKANTMSYFNEKLYIKFADNTSWSITLTSVT